jgi:1-acyl-sn-glycerol-3-phosphate acyltransferase
LIAVNHISIFEPPFVLSFWPGGPEVIAAEDIKQRRFQEFLVRLYGAFRVHRGNYDREVIENAIFALSSGRPLVVFPEGGRSHAPGLRRAQPGAAYLVEKTGAPVVPVGIVGSTDDFFQRALHGQRPILEMRIGRPFELPPVTGKGEERRSSRQRNADRIMEHIATILPPDYRGVYAETALSRLPA